jgi:hypothetical protein
VSQDVHRVAFLASPRGRVALVAMALAFLAAVGLHPVMKHRADNRVVFRTATEMPKLDTGVRQAVHVTFTGDRLPAVGHAANLKFVVTSGAAGAQVQARIVAPQEATIALGRSNWGGRLDYAQVAEIPVSVVFPTDKGGFVRGEVITTLPDGQVFSNATAVYVDPGVSDTQTPEPQTLIEPDGSTLDVVVYKNQ